MKIGLWLCLAFASVAAAQVPPAAENFAAINTLLDARTGDSLRCSYYHEKPFFDFVFRYTAGFKVSTQLARFKPGETLFLYARVKPQKGQPLFVRDAFEVPDYRAQIGDRLSEKDINRIDVELSDAFALGEGRYAVDAVLLSSQGRGCRHQWVLKAGNPAKPDKSVALPPDTAAPLDAAAWDGKLATAGHGLRLTVLLDANSLNPGASKLFVWDRAFLLQSLASLLRQLPVESVQLVAFNLDQRREIFRERSFGVKEFSELGKVLKKIETATIPYQALRRSGWSDLLLHLVHEQIQSDGTDLVVFLGPNTNLWERIPKEMLASSSDKPPQFAYLEYYPHFGAEVPDVIEFLTHDLHGTVYHVHSPGQFRQSVQKLLLKVKPKLADVEVAAGDAAPGGTAEAAK